MLQQIIAYSIKNKVIVLLFTAALAVWGVFSLMNLPIDAVPDITNNQVQVVTTSPSLAPQEVEKFITYPVELSMANIQHVEQIRSISRYGLSVVTIVFDEDFPILQARQLVSEKLQTLSSEIPPEIGVPTLMPITTGLGEIYQFVLEVDTALADRYNPMELRTIQDWLVKRQMAGIQGIVEISSFGGFVKQYEVAVDPHRLKMFGITISEVADALNQSNQNTGGSYVERGETSFYIRSGGLISTMNDIENIVVKKNDHIPVRVKDLATVREGSAQRFGAMTMDGRGEVVGGITLMLKGANAYQVVKRVEDRVNEIQKSMPPGVQIRAFLDRGKLVGNVVHTVTNNLMEGGLIVVFVLVLLLGNFRAGLIVASVIPLSMMFAISMMKLFDVSANLMSLGAIDFGLVVDGAVIIVESVIHRLHHQHSNRTIRADEMDDTVRESSQKLMKTATFGQIIILIVYLPIIALAGIEGKMFKPMAQTVAFAIVGASILSLTYVPVISSLFLSRKINTKVNFADRIILFVQKFYTPLLKAALNYRKTLLVSTVIVFALSIFIFTRMGAVFIPTLEEGDLAMQVTIRPGSTLSDMIRTTSQAESILKSNFPEVIHVVSKIGTAEIPTDPMSYEEADVMIVLKPKNEWVSAKSREDLVAQMKDALSVLAGVNFEFTQPIQLRFNELMTGVKSDIAVKIYGEDTEVLHTQAEKAKSLISDIQGVGDIKVEVTEGLQQTYLDLNEEKIAETGLNIHEVNRVIRAAMAGEVSSIVYEGEKRFDLVTRLAPEFRNREDIFSDLFVKAPDGQSFPVSQLADIRNVSGPMQITRENTRRRISIGINVRDRDIRSLVEEINSRLDKGLVLPPGYTIKYGGQFENLEHATGRLLIAVPIALLLIYILLFFTFHSFRYATLIYTAIPMSAIGGIAALWLRGMPFSISAAVGFIALFGVAVLNGIVLISCFNQLKEEGYSDLTERILEGTRQRLRPVLMTASVASLGFLPMALSTSAGGEVQQPLATVVIGGLLSATFLTLVILPLLYYVSETGFGLRKKALTVTLPILLSMGVALKSEAQTNVKLTPEEAVSRALEANPEMNISRMNTQAAKAMKLSAVDIGQTDINWQRGQINSALIDNYLTITQQFGSPAEKIARAGMLKQDVKVNQIAEEIQSRRLSARVLFLYYEAVWLRAKIRMYEQQQKQYEGLGKIAAARYRTGESNYLGTLMAEARTEEIRMTLRDLKAAQKVNEYAFRTVLFAPDSISFVPSVDSLTRPALPNVNVWQINQNSLYTLREQQTEYAKRTMRWAGSQFSPSFYAGYFNQSLDHVRGFQGFLLNMSVPIWFAPQQAEFKRRKIEYKAAQERQMYTAAMLRSAQESTAARLEEVNRRLEYYRNTGLKYADEIEKTSGALYAKGEIEYTELLQNISQSIRIRADYLDQLYECNRLVIKLKYETLND